MLFISGPVTKWSTYHHSRDAIIHLSAIAIECSYIIIEHYLNGIVIFGGQPGGETSVLACYVMLCYVLWGRISLQMFWQNCLSKVLPPRLNSSYSYFGIIPNQRNLI